MRSIFFLTVVASSLVFKSTPVAACDDVVADGSIDLEKLAQCISRPAIPSGAVLAFDRTNGCPVGWQDMGREWRGRTLVAAVPQPGDSFGFGRTGGSETHSLTVDEMPAHRHSLFLSNQDGNGSGIDAANNNANGGVANPNRMENVGEGQPHNNMPPYVALYFCKKE